MLWICNDSFGKHCPNCLTLIVFWLCQVWLRPLRVLLYSCNFFNMVVINISSILMVNLLTGIDSKNLKSTCYMTSTVLLRYGPCLSLPFTDLCIRFLYPLKEQFKFFLPWIADCMLIFLTFDWFWFCVCPHNLVVWRAWYNFCFFIK